MQAKLILVLSLVILAAAAAGSEDTVILKDGIKITGAITKEEKDAIFIREVNGEEHGIQRQDIAKVLRAGEVEKLAGVAAKPVPSMEVKQSPQVETATLIDKVNNLGSPVLAERKAALEDIKKLGASIVPILLGMLDPKQKTTEATRVGILRLLSEMAPLDSQASRTLAFDAVYDPHYEARREACRTIKVLQDDLAVSELAKYLSAGDPGVRSMAATAARELNDNRLFIAIIHSIPVPEVTANNGPASVTTRGIPMGPGGMTMPIQTGTQDVTGVAQNTDSPGAEMMKQIAGKDLGTLPYAWLNWYGEITSQLTSADYHSHKDHKRASDKLPGKSSSYP